MTGHGEPGVWIARCEDNGPHPGHTWEPPVTDAGLGPQAWCPGYVAQPIDPKPYTRPCRDKTPHPGPHSWIDDTDEAQCPGIVATNLPGVTATTPRLTRNPGPDRGDGYDVHGEPVRARRGLVLPEKWPFKPGETVTVDAGDTTGDYEVTAVDNDGRVSLRRIQPGDPQEPRELAGRLAFQHALEIQGMEDEVGSDRFDDLLTVWRELFMHLGEKLTDHGKAMVQEPRVETAAELLRLAGIFDHYEANLTRADSEHQSPYDAGTAYGYGFTANYLRTRADELTEPPRQCTTPIHDAYGSAPGRCAHPAGHDGDCTE